MALWHKVQLHHRSSEQANVEEIIGVTVIAHFTTDFQMHFPGFWLNNMEVPLAAELLLFGLPDVLFGRRTHVGFSDRNPFRSALK